MFYLNFDEKDLAIINQALNDAPYKYAAPLIDKINKQIKDQEDSQTNTESKQV